MGILPNVPAQTQETGPTGEKSRQDFSRLIRRPPVQDFFPRLILISDSYLEVAISVNGGFLYKGFVALFKGFGVDTRRA